MNTTNIDDTIRSILAGFDIDTADTISGCAAHSAKELRAQGWQGGGAEYDLGAYLGDMAALQRLLDRMASQDECNALEACIRAHLDATA